MSLRVPPKAVYREGHGVRVCRSRYAPLRFALELTVNRRELTVKTIEPTGNRGELTMDISPHFPEYP
jgi:hypothetical protein